MPGRNNVSAIGYRYGMNGQEKVDEVNGISGSHYTAEFWEYDSRSGRRWNQDPIVKVWESPYACFSNNPIYYSDPTGANAEDPIKTDEAASTDKTADKPAATTPAPKSPPAGKEVKQQDALNLFKSGKTIQEGLTNLTNGIQTGDYLTAGTLTTILNAPKLKGGGEADVNILLKGVDKLTKTDDNGFKVSLKGNKSEVSQPFTLLAGVNITIKNNATVKLNVSNADKIIVQTEGVKAGWFSLPNASISGNKLTIFGIFSGTLYK